MELKTRLDLDELSDCNKMAAKAGLVAGYKMEVRTVDFRPMLFANGKPFAPLVNFTHALRLLVDVDAYLSVDPSGVLVIGKHGRREHYRPNTDAEYQAQMCQAIVRTAAKGYVG